MHNVKSATHMLAFTGEKCPWISRSLQLHPFPVAGPLSSKLAALQLQMGHLYTTAACSEVSDLAPLFQAEPLL